MTTIKNIPISNSSLLTEAIRFEHWARFHCMREIISSEEMQEHSQKDMSKNATDTNLNANAVSNSDMQSAIIQLPEILIDVCNEEVPHLSALLDRIQNSEISLDSARTHILTFMQDKIKLNDDDFAQEIQKISASKKFTRYLDVFYTFVQEEADLEEDELTAKEAEIGAEAMAQYIEEAPIPTFATWTEKFHQWANQRNFRLELE